MDKWDKRFIEMAEQIGSWSSCYKQDRHVGAIIVKNKRVIATGYNGAPQGIKSCVERGECMRQKYGIESGTRHELCYAVHAEQNAIIQAARVGCSVEGCTLYCTHQPCVICAKIIINSGITRIVYEEGYPDTFALHLFKEAGVKLERYFKDRGELVPVDDIPDEDK
ncbi:MAG: cytidine/deoxycytidylate deaminase family protein [Clostridia bacterium]|nr:cytidine/deoxycytidylate deaminase family protein [Clostridia bacterium]